MAVAPHCSPSLAAADDDIESPPSSRHRTEPCIEAMRVLVVEDEPDARDFVRYALEVRGAQVSEAADANAALELLSGESFDVILSDIGLPAMDGLSLLRRVRASDATRRTPAVALTAYTRPTDQKHAFEAGFQAHVAKPVNIGELVTALASVTGRLPSLRGSRTLGEVEGQSPSNARPSKRAT